MSRAVGRAMRRRSLIAAAIAAVGAPMARAAKWTFENRFGLHPETLASPDAVTWDPATASAGIVRSNGNLTVTTTTQNNYEYAFGSLVRATGKRCFAIQVFDGAGDNGNEIGVGVVKSTFDVADWIANGGGNGNITFAIQNAPPDQPGNGSITVANGQWVWVAADIDAGKYWIGSDEAGWVTPTSGDPADPAAGTDPDFAPDDPAGNEIPTVAGQPLLPFVYFYLTTGTTAHVVANFGATTLPFALPAGFTAWSA